MRTYWLTGRAQEEPFDLIQGCLLNAKETNVTEKEG